MKAQTPCQTGRAFSPEKFFPKKKIVSASIFSTLRFLFKETWKPGLCLTVVLLLKLARNLGPGEAAERNMRQWFPCLPNQGANTAEWKQPAPQALPLHSAPFPRSSAGPICRDLCQQFVISSSSFFNPLFDFAMTWPIFSLSHVFVNFPKACS